MKTKFLCSFYSIALTVMLLGFDVVLADPSGGGTSGAIKQITTKNSKPLLDIVDNLFSVLLTVLLPIAGGFLFAAITEKRNGDRKWIWSGVCAVGFGAGPWLLQYAAALYDASAVGLLGK